MGVAGGEGTVQMKGSGGWAAGRGRRTSFLLGDSRQVLGVHVTLARIASDCSCEVELATLAALPIHLVVDGPCAVRVDVDLKPLGLLFLLRLPLRLYLQPLLEQLHLLERAHLPLDRRSTHLTTSAEELGSAAPPRSPHRDDFVGGSGLSLGSGRLMARGGAAEDGPRPLLLFLIFFARTRMGRTEGEGVSCAAVLLVRLAPPLPVLHPGKRGG